MNIQALIDKAVDQIIKSVQVMIQKVRKESTKIYNGIVVSNNGDGRWNIRYNGEVHAVRLYGETPPMIDSTVKVFVPQGNQNLAWFITPPIEGGGGGGGTSGVDSFNGRTGTVIGIAGDYTADMVGARPNTWLPTPNEIGAVPKSTTVNGKSLSSNITLQASDVGAVPTSRTVNGQALNNDVTLTGSNIAVSANDSTTVDVALSNKVSHFGNVTKFDTVLAAASAMTVDGTFFGDPVSSIYNAADKPPNTYDVGYFVMLDGTMGRRVVLAFGYAADSGHRYVGTRDVYNSEWLDDWRELAPATPPQEFALPLTSGIANFSNGDISRYWKNQFSEVTVAFALKSIGAIVVDQVIATLPVGYRPIAPVRSAGVCAIGNVYSPFVVYIGTDGNINAGFLPGSSQYDGLFAEITFISSS